MDELIQDFIRRSVAELKNTSRQIQKDAFPPEIFLRKTFRTLHTIKGTAQAFGYANAANLAHALENLVSDYKNDADFSLDFPSVLREGIELLTQSLEAKSFQIPLEFKAKIARFSAEVSAPPFDADELEEIPESVSAKLSAQEKSNLKAALRGGKTLFVLEIGFDAARLADFKNFRKNLIQKGEIIAVLPCAKYAARKKIGFQVIVVSRENIAHFAAKNSAEIVLELHKKPTDSVQSVLAKIVGHGRESARMLDREIEFVVLADDFRLPPERLKLVFDLLLHLVRNAVSHAIAEKGAVEIDLKAEEKGLTVSVSDDGKGLDIEKIRTRAAEQNLSFNSETEITNLIFLPGFTTVADAANEISGRGIGLDVVKNLVESANGRISVRTEKDGGTKFEIFLPTENESASRENATEK